jgi:hypothetical protein
MPDHTLPGKGHNITRGDIVALTRPNLGTHLRLNNYMINHPGAQVLSKCKTE